MLESQASRTVPFFNYPWLFAAEERELTDLIVGVCRRGAYILQQDLKDFEADFARYLGMKYAIGVGNATDGLLIALEAAGIGPGHEVIFSSHTFIATASPIHHCGATPVPVECGPDHLIDPAAVERAITPRTKAIIPTQLNGRTCDMDAILEIAKKHDLLVLEDAAQALGSKWKGRMAGTFGLASTFSFFPAKNLGCFGDGGAIVTNDEALYRKMMLLRDHGRDPQTGEVVAWAYNSRLDNLQAAILGHRLKKFDQIIARRREIAGMYQEFLGGMKQLTLPPAPGAEADHFDTFQNYEIEAEKRDQLKEHLQKNGVGTLLQWGGRAVHQFSKLGFTQKLPFTERLFTRMIMLPMNVSLSNEDVKYVADCVRKFYG